MLRCTIEIVPYGEEPLKRLAAELVRRAIEALGWMARYGKRSRKRSK